MADSHAAAANAALPRLPEPHLVLVGLPGSGKTSVGRALAERLGRPFLDFDEEIERREALPVSRIFANRGERYFRSLERQLTEEMRHVGGGMVLAPGGGWVTVPGVVQTLRPPALIVYLAVEPATALARMGLGRARRPLLEAGDPLASLTGLQTLRGPTYHAVSDLLVQTEDMDQQEVTNRIVEWTSIFGWNRL